MTTHSKTHDSLCHRRCIAGHERVVAGFGECGEEFSRPRERLREGEEHAVLGVSICGGGVVVDEGHACRSGEENDN